LQYSKERTAFNFRSPGSTRPHPGFVQETRRPRRSIRFVSWAKSNSGQYVTMAAIFCNCPTAKTFPVLDPA
jgi:hypothetical protein